MAHTNRAQLGKRKAIRFLLSSSAEGIFWILLFLFIVTTSSCTKGPVIVPPAPAPVENLTRQIDLGNKEIPFWGSIAIIDFDGDRFPELIFEILPLGDPIVLRDRWLWQVKTTRFTALPINPNVDQVPALNEGEVFSLNDFDVYEWYLGNTITLFEKITYPNDHYWWEGNWKGVSHKFLPFKVLRADGYYAGWVEISSDLEAKKGYLHRAGISKLPNTPVKAGF